MADSAIEQLRRRHDHAVLLHNNVEAERRRLHRELILTQDELEATKAELAEARARLAELEPPASAEPEPDAEPVADAHD